MTPSVRQIWRHPIKAHGREPMVSAALAIGGGLPFDRKWAVLHDAGKSDASAPGAWQRCINFSRGAGTPLLQALTSQFDLATNTLTLTHPKLPGITVNPDNANDQQRLIAWLAPLVPTGRPAPTAIIRADNAMTDSETVSLSLINLASHEAIAQQLGQALSPLRWRGNLLVQGIAPWQEQSWVGRHIRIGSARFYIRKEITRCRMTEANPDNGVRDADTLGALKSGFGHQEMGVHAVVVQAGEITVDDKIEIED